MRRDQAETHLLLELITTCCERRSMVIAASQPFGQWDSVFPSATLTIDGLVHHAVVFEMNVESHNQHVGVIVAPHQSASIWT